jgi:hypothetical protein
VPGELTRIRDAPVPANARCTVGRRYLASAQEVAEHQRFADLVEVVTAVSEAICAARPAAGPAASPPAEGERGGS